MVEKCLLPCWQAWNILSLAVLRILPTLRPFIELSAYCSFFCSSVYTPDTLQGLTTSCTGTVQPAAK